LEEELRLEGERERERGRREGEREEYYRM